METLRFEFKKILKNNYGRILIPILIIAIIIISMAMSEVGNQKLEANKDSYYALISSCNLCGKVTADSEKSLAMLEDKLNKAQEDFDNIFFDYQIGKIDRSEYLSLTNDLIDLLNQKDVIDIIKSQFEYCKEDTENRYVMYSNGWNMLFSKNGGMLFSLFAIFIVTLSFAGDTDDGMKRFLVTCKNGRRKLIFSKLISTELITVVSYLAYLFAFGTYVKIKCGLDNGFYPIQSLELYAEYIGSNSIISAFLSVCIIRLLSIMSCIAIITMLYTIINSSTGAIALSFALVFIPMIIDIKALNYFPQRMINYNLFDVNFYIAFGINVLIIIVTAMLGNIFWKRKSNQK